MRFDLDLRITAWDTAAEKLFGWTAEEAIGQIVRELVPGNGDTLARLRDVRTRGSWSGVLVVANRASEHVAIEVRTTAERNGDGRIVSYRAANREARESELYRAARRAEVR